MSKRLVLCAALLMVVSGACGRGPLVVSNQTASADYWYAPMWLKDADLEERTITAARTAAKVWGGSPEDLDGWTIAFVSAPITDCVKGAVNSGCTSSTPVGGLIRIFPRADPCVELTALAHEIGHVILDDGDHSDRRWCDPTFWNHMGAVLAEQIKDMDPACASILTADNALLLVTLSNCHF